MHGRVESIEWLTPSYVRLVLNGDGLAEYAPVPYTDSYVNVAIPPADARTPRRSRSTSSRNCRASSDRSGAASRSGAGTPSRAG